MIERRIVQRHLRMVCFDDESDRFQMRAAGIALRNGRVLVQNISGETTTSIPGGRIDQNESSAETVVREMAEEFGRRVDVGPLAFLIESFFPDKGQQFHEIGFFYPIRVPDDFPYHATEICHRFREGSVELEYRWIEATPAALAACCLYPAPLRHHLQRLPSSVMHILDRPTPA